MHFKYSLSCKQFVDSWTRGLISLQLGQIADRTAYKLVTLRTSQCEDWSAFS